MDVERAVQRLKKKKKEWEGKRKQLENAQRQRREQQENQIEYLREEQRKLMNNRIVSARNIREWRMSTAGCPARIFSRGKKGS